MSNIIKQQKNNGPVQRNNYKIIISSQFAAIISNIIITPFDVIKIRQQKSVNQSPEIQKQYKSMFKTMSHIFKNEGYMTFFNGLRYNLFRTMGANFTMFLCYENLKFYLFQKYNNFLLVPLVASGISQTLAATVTFPFEYFKTVSQSQQGVCNKKGFSLGNNLTSAYLMTIQRNCSFHLVYWPIGESIRNQLGYYDKKNGYKTGDIKFIELILINSISGFIAGGLAAIVSQPFDVVKTQKQVFPEMSKMGSLKIMQNQYQKQGIFSLFTGIEARVSKLVIYGALMLSLYESSQKTLDNLF